MRPKIGVLAVQGGFAAHLAHLESVEASGVEVRTPDDLVGLDGLILPGGESTTIMMGIEAAGLEAGILGHHHAGRPVLGTCAGMIVSDREHLGLIDITTKRNAFGRQLASFEDDIEFGQVEGGPVRGVFIRAPWVEEVGDGVEVLAEVRDHPVAVRQGTVTAISFHPELTSDDRVHAWFRSVCSS
ncbi:MAG: pyridoxal 5'-phosphate synthase glutaminase subunit PdxT [Actinomycetota bacterium]|nr:pyridoxal 5'-phosphate synthase glutaminase subunit PdxT [Actinomycetota bacterium]